MMSQRELIPLLASRGSDRGARALALRAQARLDLLRLFWRGGSTNWIEAMGQAAAVNVKGFEDLQDS
jgi:hypothetical protein